MVIFENSDMEQEGRVSDSSVQPATIHRTKRNLPHWRQPGAIYFTTFRLREGQLQAAEQQLVLDACLFWHEKKWRVEGVVVMPNHVHILAQPLRVGRPASGLEVDTTGPATYHSLNDILHSIKGFTARQINRQRGTSGALWLDEYRDRIIRDREELQQKLEYMANNPVKAGLCRDYQDYPYFWHRTR